MKSQLTKKSVIAVRFSHGGEEHGGAPGKCGDRTADFFPGMRQVIIGQSVGTLHRRLRQIKKFEGRSGNTNNRPRLPCFLSPEQCA